MPVDVWGRIYLDEWKGVSGPHSIERDDGLVHTFESAANYFEAPRSDAEREILDQLEGPVLDLGAGVGAYALYLQNRGLTVTAGDASAGAVDVCRARGCLDARLMDVRALDRPSGEYRGIIVMGNTLGVHQSPETLPGLLRTLRGACVPGAKLVCTTVDPLETDDPAHLAYHRRNRSRSRPPGLTRIRLRYRDLVDDWVGLWLPTTEELHAAVSGSGWSLAERHTTGPHRTDCYAAVG